MKKVLTVIFAGSAFCATAQTGPNPDAYAKTITAADMQKHLYIVASPEMEGRETGTDGQHKAAAYIENYVKGLGLKPGNGNSYQVPYNLYQDSLVSAAIEVAGKSFELGKDFSTTALNNAGTLHFTDAVFVGASTDTSTLGNLSGKLVVMTGGSQPAGRGPNPFMMALQNRGAAGILTVSKSNNFTVFRNGRQRIDSPRSLAKRPQAFTVSETIARAIMGADYDNAATMTAPKTYPVNVTLDVKKASVTSPASDVVAVLPGTDLKDQWLVFSAHYDHLGKRNGVLYPGADDDGSGTVGVLEIAEAFAKAAKEGKGPRRSILFLWNSGEEKGLLGSEWYTDHPIYPLAKTTADLNIDMIGRSDPDRKPDTLNYVYVVGDDKLSSELKLISEGINNKYTKLQLDYKYNDPNDKERIYFRSDHYNFARYGVPIIFYYDGMLRPDYHKPTDTPDKINYDLMQKRAQLVFYTGWEMANREAMLKRDIPLNVPTGF